MSRWERGEALPGARALNRLARLTGKPVEYFLTDPAVSANAADYLVSRRYAQELNRALALMERVAEATGARGREWEAFIRVLEMSAAAEEFKRTLGEEAPREATK